MWRLATRQESADPLLESANGLSGRQVWLFDKDAGSQQLLDEVEQLRASFTLNRHHLRQNSDSLLRIQKRPVLKVLRCLSDCMAT
jgi:hypothetical protein